MTQKDFIKNISQKNKDAIIIGSLGTISEDLEESKHQWRILLKGAMGCALGVALGYAMSSKKKVICLIGEGSLLMKLGSLSTLLAYKPKNLQLYVLDNGNYKSCGGQLNNFKFISKYLPIKIIKV